MSTLSTDLLSPDSFYSSGPPTGGRHTCCSRLRERLHAALLADRCTARRFLACVLCVPSLLQFRGGFDTLVRDFAPHFAGQLDFVENALVILFILTCAAQLLMAERAVFYKCIMHSGIGCYERQCQDCGGHGGAKCCGTVVAYVYKMLLASFTWLYVMLGIATVAWLGMLFVIWYEISFALDKVSLALDLVQPLIDAQCLVGKNGTCAVEAVHLTANYVEENWLGGCDNTPPPPPWGASFPDVPASSCSNWRPLCPTSLTTTSRSYARQSTTSSIKCERRSTPHPARLIQML